MGNNISYAFTDRQVSNSTGDGFGPGNELSGIRYALIAAPVFNPYKPDGSYYNVSSELGDPTLFGDGNANPLALIDATNWTIQRSRIFGNIFAELTLFKALVQIASYYGVKMNEIVGIGDYYNDINFCKEVGFVVALNNAVKELKAIADFITTNDFHNEGINEFLEYFLNIHGVEHELKILNKKVEDISRRRSR